MLAQTYLHPCACPAMAWPGKIRFSDHGSCVRVIRATGRRQGLKRVAGKTLRTVRKWQCLLVAGARSPAAALRVQRWLRLERPSFPAAQGARARPGPPGAGRGAGHKLWKSRPVCRLPGCGARQRRFPGVRPARSRMLEAQVRTSLRSEVLRGIKGQRC